MTRVLLRDLAPGQTYALKFRSISGIDASEWSQIQRFTTTNDTMPPAALTNVTWTDSGTSFVGHWDIPTTNADGTPLKDLRDYHCNVSVGGMSADFYVTGPKFEFSSQQNIATFGSLQTTLTLTVTARDLTYNESAPVTLTATPLNPPTPSTPTVSNYIGLLKVLWDGKDTGGNAMPINFSYCEVHVSTTSGFTPDATTYVGMIQPGGNSLSYIVAGLTYGNTYYIKIVSVNALGKKSAGSAQASGVPARITGLDIQNGQIASEQINWTATGIPGGNAYYQNTAPTLAQAIGGTFTSNDVWYDTGHSYQTNKWNGTQWNVDTSVGFIPATKIIAGTITGDRIAANFFDAALANIGSAFIDSAMITSITAGQITTGTLTAAVTVSGSLATSATANRGIKIDNTGIKGWDSSGNQVITFNGTSNLLTGTFQTALTGRRIQLGANGNYGNVDFYAPNGTYSYLNSRSIPYNGSTIEGLQMGVPIANTNTDRWNVLRVDGAEFLSSWSGNHQHAFWDAWSIWQATDKGTGTDVSGTRPVSTQRFFIDQSALQYNEPGNGTTGYQRFRIDISTTDGGNVWFNWPNTSARLLIMPSPRVADTSATIQFATNYNYGAQIWHRSTSSGTSARIEFHDVNGANYQDLWASAFAVQSSGTVKTNVQPVATATALAAVKGMKVKTFNRRKGQKNGALPTDPVEYNERTETGLISEEAPEAVVVRDETGAIFGLDLGSQIGVLTAALQELAAQVDALKNGNGK